MNTMIRKFFLIAKISIKGGLDMKYITTVIKYLTKAVETLTLISPIIRGFLAIWNKKKED